MLLKWLFTLLAILWLYQALRDVFGTRHLRNHQQAPPPPPPPAKRGKDAAQDGEYIDYEEVKD